VATASAGIRLLSHHADKLTDDGRQRLVRHGHLPEREIMTGIGHHTRSLCGESPAQSEQWCCWIGRSWIVSGPAEIAAIACLQRSTNARASIPADILALGSSCVSHTPQLKRE